MNDPSRQVEEFAREWATAEQHGDAAFLEDALADDFNGDPVLAPGADHRNVLAVLACLCG